MSDNRVFVDTNVFVYAKLEHEQNRMSYNQNGKSSRDNSLQGRTQKIRRRIENEFLGR
jgi:predicted nucleic acid-binding protein